MIIYATRIVYFKINISQPKLSLLFFSFQKAKTSQLDYENTEEEDEEIGIRETQELLDQINDSKENNGGRIEDHFVIKFLRERLTSMPCQNQGFILDGYPKTITQAKLLFTSELFHY